jgi:hypothetical protein
MWDCRCLKRHTKWTSIGCPHKVWRSLVHRVDGLYLLEKLIVAHPVKKLLSITSGTRILITVLIRARHWSYHETDYSCPHPPILFLQIHFNIFPFTHRLFHMVAPLQVSRPKLWMRLTFLPYKLCSSPMSPSFILSSSQNSMANSNYEICTQWNLLQPRVTSSLAGLKAPLSSPFLTNSNLKSFPNIRDQKIHIKQDVI